MGSITGLLIGHNLEVKYVGYNEKAKPLFQVLKYLLGLLLAVAIQEGFKKILPYGNFNELTDMFLDLSRYLLLTLYISLGAPALFKLIFKNKEV